MNFRPSRLPPLTFGFLLLIFSQLSSAALLEPWIEQDIGVIGRAGAASFGSSSSCAVTGSGVGIAGNADGFHYVFQSLNGDGQIVARVATQENPNG